MNRGLLRRAGLVFLGAAPFLFVYCKQYFVSGTHASGFLVGDYPYYMANARAIFERGNGFFAPNAYDPDPAAPAIYFHWLLWLCGFCIVHLGIDPGYLLTFVGLMGGLTCSWLTLKLVEHVLPENRFRGVLFLATMWGGGVLCLGKIVHNLFLGFDWNDSLLYFDPFAGWWCQNWGRNITIPTEADYHALMAAAWLAFLRKQNKLGIVFTALLASTHPFSGVELLLMASAWTSLRLILDRDKNAAFELLIVLLLFCVFAWYYFVFLESYSQHRELRARWSLDWSLRWSSFFLAYGPVAILAFWRLSAFPESRDRNSAFLLICFAVAFLLSKHDAFMTPKQPLHFTRGYPWLPLWLIALPLVQKWLKAAEARFSQFGFRRVLVYILLIWCLDNVVFVGRTIYPGRFPEAHKVTPKLREMFAFIRSQKLQGMLLCPDSGIARDVSYLSAAYTQLRPFYGHGYNSPNNMQRQEAADRWFYLEEPTPFDLAKPDFLLFPSDVKPPTSAAEWATVHENGEWTLLKRKNVK